MNANFKPLGLAAAVATATAGYVGVAQAELAGNTQLGDLGLVPYYTVNDGYATGMSIINTASVTQVVKVRLRRAEDSMDALDFNVVLSPYDVYTGTIAKKGDDIFFVSNDNSCTAPEYPAGGFKMPFIYRDGAEEGYVEIISMGSPDSETAAIALAAKHGADGIPANCAGVRDNFYKGGVSGSTRGNVNSVLTVQMVPNAEGVMVPTDNNYVVSPDSLKVSYFIKSDETGVEFGNNAVHIAGHMDGASMTNQQTGVFDGDLQGFDHPDLNGGAPFSVFTGVSGAASRGLYDSVVRPAIGAEALINDWSKNANGPFTVDTDWVVTVPGQYLMLDLPTYLQVLNPLNPDAECNAGDPNNVQTGDETEACDFRDIPLTAQFTVYDREERGIVVDPGDLVVSPQPPGVIETVTLDQEVNVIEWGEAPVLNAAKTIDVPVPAGAQFGWSNLKVTATTAKTQAICDFNGSPTAPTMSCVEPTSPVPLIGFVAWQRNFADLPAANYGRIVEHSRVVSSPAP